MLPKELGLALNAFPPILFAMHTGHLFSLYFFPLHFFANCFVDHFRISHKPPAIQKPQAEKHRSRGYCNIKGVFGGKNMGKAHVSQGRQSQ